MNEKWEKYNNILLERESESACKITIRINVAAKVLVLKKVSLSNDLNDLKINKLSIASN